MASMAEAMMGMEKRYGPMANCVTESSGLVVTSPGTMATSSNP